MRCRTFRRVAWPLAAATALVAVPAPGQAAIRPGGFDALAKVETATALAATHAWRTPAGRAALVRDAAPGRARRSGDELFSGRLEIAAADGAPLAPILRALPAGTAVVDHEDELGIAIVEGDTAAIARSLAPRGDVAQVVPERRRRLAAEPLEDTDVETGLPFTWHLDEIHALAALALVPGGRGVPVGVLDTGVGSGVSDLQGGVIAARMSFVPPPGYAANDRIGHGTFIAGLISAIVDGRGTRGVAGRTPIYSGKVDLPNGDIDTLAEARAMMWAVQHGAKVLNLSNAGFCPLEPAEARGIGYALAHDVLVVAAAGNDAEVGNPIECPAAWLGAPRGAWSVGLSVGASTPQHVRAPFSTYNPFLSLAAPGGNADDQCKGVVSTVPVTVSDLFPVGVCTDVTQTLNGKTQRWVYAQGTSFSTPIVAGVAALVRKVKPALTALQTADVVVRPDGALDWATPLGFGIVDAQAAVAAARTYDSQAPTITRLVVSRRGDWLAVGVRATDAAGPGEVPAGGELEYQIEIQVNGRWRRLYRSTTPPTTAHPLRLPPGLGPVTLRIRVKDDHLNVAQRIVTR